MTAGADSIKSLKKVEITDPFAAGFTNQKTRIINKQHYKTNNYAYIDSPTKGLSKT